MDIIIYVIGPANEASMGKMSMQFALADYADRADRANYDVMRKILAPYLLDHQWMVTDHSLYPTLSSLVKLGDDGKTFKGEKIWYSLVMDLIDAATLLKMDRAKSVGDDTQSVKD